MTVVDTQADIQLRKRPPLIKTESSPALHTPFNKKRPLFFKARMGIYVIQTVIMCYEQQGIPLSLGFYRLISKDGLALLISDMCMVGMTLFSVLFSKLLVWRVIKYETTGWILQHMCQMVFLMVPICWIFMREWPWVQSGFFTMHTVVMMMKMHSYTSLNGDLSIKHRRLQHLTALLPTYKSDNNDTDTQDRLKHMEEEMDYLQEELTHGDTRYPENITIRNYMDFLLVPSLVYWMEYPRTERIRPWYIVEKTLATLGTFLLLYITTECYILPKLYDPTLSEARVIIELMYPFMINYLFIFYIIFECILNAFAELSRFADRNFYDDWWNSITYDEFARKWNKPVHQWLLRHVYAQSIESYNITKQNATFFTFLLSSCLHELVLVVCTRKIRMYLFVLQMLQIPLIMAGRHPWIRAHSMVGNFFFWLCMLFGPPFLGILYCREAFWAYWANTHSTLV
ncbi:MBOAT-domain-containing protein [Spinellus fusiger]|nr:MBOAT-domain-containing protein [Spinellus fusiger]